MSKFKTSRFSDFSGGINLRNSADRINDNQFQELINMSSEGNKLVLIKGFKFLKQLTGDGTVGKIQGMELFSNYLICVFKANLYIYNLSTGVVSVQASAVTSQTDRFQILVSKMLDISIILVNTNQSTTEDIKAYEFDISTLIITNKVFVGLTDKNFKCGAFKGGRLLLGGNPKASSVLYYSRISTSTTPGYWYDFSAYEAGSQVIGDGYPIVSFASNNTEFFIFKESSVWKITGDKDSGTAFSYIIQQETSTGIINAFCIVNVEKDIIYFDGTTFRRISYEQNIQALSDSAIGKDIEPGIKALSQNQKDNAFMVYAYPYVKLVLRSNTSAVNDFAILYNVVDKGFSTQVGIDGYIGTNGIFNNQRVAYIGSQFDSSVFQDNEGLNYNDGDIRFKSRSKKVNFGDGVNYKQFLRMEFNGIITIGLLANITIYVDGKEIVTKVINSSPSSELSPTLGSATFGSSPFGSNNTVDEGTTTRFETKIELYNSGRDIEYIISGSGQGMIELNGQTITYKHTLAYDTH